MWHSKNQYYDHFKMITTNPQILGKGSLISLWSYHWHFINTVWEYILWTTNPNSRKVIVAYVQTMTGAQTFLLHWYLCRKWLNISNDNNHKGLFNWLMSHPYNEMQCSYYKAIGLGWGCVAQHPQLLLQHPPSRHEDLSSNPKSVSNSPPTKKTQ
jgi:hypothetical protein